MTVEEQGEKIVCSRLVDVEFRFGVGVVWWLESVRPASWRRATHQVVGRRGDCLDVTPEDISVPLFQRRTSDDNTSTSNPSVGF